MGEYICRMPTRCTSSSYVWTNQYPMALALPPKFNEVDIRNETLLRQVRAKSELGDLLVRVWVWTPGGLGESSPTRLQTDWDTTRMSGWLLTWNPPPPSSPTCPGPSTATRPQANTDSQSTL